MRCNVHYSPTTHSCNTVSNSFDEVAFFCEFLNYLCSLCLLNCVFLEDYAGLVIINIDISLSIDAYWLTIGAVMELRQIKYFLAVANYGGVRKASQVLHVTQPAISRQVSELEGELGVQLFERASRRLTLTLAGEYYRDQMSEMMNNLENTTQMVKRVALGSIGNLKLGSVESVLWEGLVPKYLSTFREKKSRYCDGNGDGQYRKVIGSN